VDIGQVPRSQFLETARRGLTSAMAENQVAWGRESRPKGDLRKKPKATMREEEVRVFLGGVLTPKRDDEPV
jgi:hypothetical protein